ncbi:hypothetical protein [Frigoribacterium sp. VKM Ac-2530]|uniref:hypothetical protein n=1 Tax=Frigoribacterium sp. VKM Ac-2530 TaxID=2783822 RepID=UPI00188DC1B3|nr:hypothetical protein [Frigoribacterium sp. VKM Ac-2530]MBF4578918.1 hypothetical protein [Frigoribacterium sp. VKM Ac-2530]
MLTPKEHYNTANALVPQIVQLRTSGRLAQADDLIALATLHANLALAGTLIHQDALVGATRTGKRAMRAAIAEEDEADAA